MNRMLKLWRIYLLPTVWLCLLALWIGILTGALTAGFGRVLLQIGAFRMDHLKLVLPFLPLAGLLMVWVYQTFGKQSSRGMGLIFDAARGKASSVPLRLIPLLIGSTWLTHLCGGSAGREGVAVQLGAAAAHNIGRSIPTVRSIPHAVPILTIAGMAAGFSGLFHTPIAAVCFALEVTAVGLLEYRALLPAAIASLSAWQVSLLLGLETFSVTLPKPNFAPLSGKTLLLGVLSGILGGLFCLLLRIGKQQTAKWLPNPLLRIVLCGAVLALLLGLCRAGRYTGLGTNLIEEAFSGGTIYSTDAALKLLFTIVTLSIGFQGGEVTPLFAIGASLGVALAPLLGISPVMAAALCYAAVFGSASNTLLAPICIGVEVFGYSALPYFVIACTAARLCNGNRSMYGGQLSSPLFLSGCSKPIDDKDSGTNQQKCQQAKPIQNASLLEKEAG